MPIDHAEAFLINWYPTVEFAPELTAKLQDFILDEVSTAQHEIEAEAASAARRKSKLEKEQTKLLQAHYNDAIPIDLLKVEQNRIAGELSAIEQRLIAAEQREGEVAKNLKNALEFTTDIAAAYQCASEGVRRQMNQALFAKVLLTSHGITSVRLTEMFELLLNPKLVQVAFQDESEADLQEFDQLFQSLVAENEETPDAEWVGGSKMLHMVGVEV